MERQVASLTVDCKVNAAPALMLSDHYIRRARTGHDEEDSEEEDEDEEDEDEESEEGSEVEQAAGSTPQPELTRTERRELKKKQAAQKQKERDEGGEDADLINPNHVEKKLNISDLGAPRELTRRERCATIILNWFWPEQLSFREQKEKQEAKDRYWKVYLVCCPAIIIFLTFVYPAACPRKDPRGEG
jgi:hypothetical protein